MAKETKEVQLSPADQKALDTFNKMKTSIDDQVTALKLIKVIDTNSLEIANKQLSKGKEYLKEVDNAHKLTKEPALRFCQAADAAKKDIKSPLELAMASVETEVLNFNAAEERKAAEKTRLANKAAQKEADALKKEMGEFEKRAFDQIEKATTEEELSQIYQSYIQQFPEKYDPIVKGRITALGTAKFNLIQKRVSQEDYTKVLNELKGIKPELTVTVKPSFDTGGPSYSGTLSNVKKKWDFQVLDASQVPREWMSVDESKIKAWMKENEDNLTAGVRTGVHFFITDKLKIK